MSGPPEVLIENLTQDYSSINPWHEVMRRLAGDFGARLVPTVETFRAHQNDDLMIDYIHPNAWGNELLAAEVARVIAGDR